MAPNRYSIKSIINKETNGILFGIGIMNIITLLYNFDQT